MGADGLEDSQAQVILLISWYMYKTLILRYIMERDGQCRGTLPLKVTHKLTVRTNVLIVLLCNVFCSFTSTLIEPLENK